MVNRCRLLAVLPVVAAVGFAVPAGAAPHRAVAPAAGLRPATTGDADAITPSAPIKHVVIVFQENHSFDNVLGKLCVQDNRCDGATSGQLYNGDTIPLAQAADLVPDVAHSTGAQKTAVNGGAMNGFQKLSGCGQPTGYRCYSQFDPAQIPNTAALARQFVVSDRTFAMEEILSFGAHLDLITTNLDGFNGSNPKRAKYAPTGSGGWGGCDNNSVASWHGQPSDPLTFVPACIPRPDGTGTFWDQTGPNGAPQTSPVQNVPTLFDRLDQAGVSWKQYSYTKAFDVCRYVAYCVDHDLSNVVDNRQILTDAANGTLPAVSFVLPGSKQGDNSQHNGHSMLLGDNWIGQVASALQNGPEWGSTALFVTWDDCGCFYDHVPPPAGWGLRLPMIIASPYARAGFTDSNPTTYAGMLTFVEHLFDVPPLTPVDAGSYDYQHSFDFRQQPKLSRTRLATRAVPKAELRYLAAHPGDPDDPT